MHSIRCLNVLRTFRHSFREKSFLRRTGRRRKRSKFFFRCGEKTLRGFVYSPKITFGRWQFRRTYGILKSSIMAGHPGRKNADKEKENEYRKE